MSELQSVIFKKSYGWIPYTSRLWLKKYRLIPIKNVDTSIKSQLRYRIKDPIIFNYFITKKIPKRGINLIIGFR